MVVAAVVACDCVALCVELYIALVRVPYTHHKLYLHPPPPSSKHPLSSIPPQHPPHTTHRVTIPPPTCEAYAHRPLSAADWAKVLSWAVALEGMIRRKRLLEMYDSTSHGVHGVKREGNVGKVGDVGDAVVGVSDGVSSSGLEEGEEEGSVGSEACRCDEGVFGCAVYMCCAHVLCTCCV